MSMIQNMEKVHRGVFSYILGLFLIYEIPCTTEVGIWYIYRGVEIREGGEGDLAVAVMVCRVDTFVVALVGGGNVPVEIV